MDTTDRTAALLQTLRGDAQTLVRNPNSTVSPAQDGRTGAHVLELLRALGRPPPAVTTEGTLGRGGMGVVELATQVPLGRKVAVKRLVTGHAQKHDVEALLGEAWLAGSLEHPNIVPVHDLGLDAEGLPVLVMKRIEGQSWSHLLRDRDALEAHAPGRPALEAHLRILIQVCNALHYAHSREVVHRDVKPDNVMIGAFGEVCLVDWGIATAPGPALQLAGTPVYMAPEMLGGEHAVISARTDVYLLGAVLCEVLTGKPPHDATTAEALAASVMASSPTLPPDAPVELAATARLCMSRDPMQRPESALAVRLALEDFLAHMGSLELASQAERRLVELQALLASPTPDERRVFDFFSECRFGFQQALRAWAQNTRARHGLDTAVRAMVRFELKSGSARSAQSLLAELLTADEALQAEVEAALGAEAARRQQLVRLEALEKSLDPKTGGVQRTTAALIAGILWTLVPLIGKPLADPFPRYEMLFSAAVSTSSFFAVWWAGKHTRDARTPLNEQLLRIILFTMGTQTVTLVSLHFAIGDLGPLTVPFMAAFWAIISGVIATALMPATWLTGLGYLATAVLSYRFPDWRYEAIALGNAVFTLNVLLMRKHLTPKAS